MIKKLLLAAATALALVGPAQAAIAPTGSFTGGLDNTYSFSTIINTSGSKTLTFTLSSIAAGVYDVLGSLAGSNFLISSASFNGQALDVVTFGNFSYSPIEYSGLSPFTVSITGSKVGVGPGLLSGSVIVSAVPEPESIAMMLAGLGIIAAVVRRRIRSTGFSAPVAA